MTVHEEANLFVNAIHPGVIFGINIRALCFDVIIQGAIHIVHKPTPNMEAALCAAVDYNGFFRRTSLEGDTIAHLLHPDWDNSKISRYFRYHARRMRQTILPYDSSYPCKYSTEEVGLLKAMQLPVSFTCFLSETCRNEFIFDRQANESIQAKMNVNLIETLT
ncbi:hypothetical protein Trydic_g11107 [Trypoxylus dichotomus]